MRQQPSKESKPVRREWGSGSVVEESPGLFRLRASVGTGEDRRQKKARFRGTKAGAERKYRELVAELEAPTYAKGSLAELVERYCSDREGLGRSPVTVAEYRRKLAASIEPHPIGARPVAELGAGELDRFYRDLTRAGAGAPSVRSIHKLISGALSAGVRWGYAPANVASSATPPSAPAPEVHAPESDELVGALDEIARPVAGAGEKGGQGWRKGEREGSPHLAAALRFSAMFGLRRGEACALRWSDLDVEGRRLHVKRSLCSTPGGGFREGPTKGKRARVIPLALEELEELEAHRLACELSAHAAGVELRRDGFIFTMPSHPSGAAPMRPDYVTNRTRTLTDGELHPHATRHYYATELVAGGVDVRTGAALLGHADNGELLLSTYAHVRDEKHAGAAGVVSGRLRRS
jgi:integrase